MEIRFDDKDLEAYANGENIRLARTLDPKLYGRFERMLNAIRVAKRMEDLWAIPSYKAERIKGTEAEWSLRLNDKWRVHAEVFVEPSSHSDEPATVVLILRISPHKY